MTPRAKQRLLAVVALLVVFGTLGYLSTQSMSEDLVYYWSPTELVDKGDAAIGATVRLGGMVEQESVDWRPQEQHLSFRITDGEESVQVAGKGAPPQMFREGIGVVVEGKMEGDGVFHTTTVMIKHSNEYQPPEEGEMPTEVYKSLQTEER